jgi:signal transduction histidine kinase
MPSGYDPVADEGLRFFGAMTASITHEIKNILSVVNETAGLLTDLSALARQGRPLDLQRVDALAGKVLVQVERANQVVRRLNRFSHSIDTPLGEIELGDLLVFVKAMSDRLAAMQGLTLAVDTDKEPVKITSSPFLLQNLLWLCLETAMKAAGKAATVTLSASSDSNTATLCFSGLEALGQISPERFFSHREKALSALLHADIVSDPDNGRLCVCLPRHLDAASGWV